MSGKRKPVQHTPRGRKSEPIPPEYLNRYKTLEGKIGIFRSLSKDDQKFVLKAVFLEQKPVKCLNCNKKSTSSYGLAYHLERCGMDKDEAPWKCLLCEKVMIRAEAAAHKQHCRLPPEVPVAPISIIGSADTSNVVYTSSGRISRRVAAVIVEENTDTSNERKNKRKRLESEEFEPSEFDVIEAEEPAEILSRPRVSMDGRGHLSKRKVGPKIVNGSSTGVKIRPPTLNSDTRLNKVDVRRFIDRAFNAFIQNIKSAETSEAIKRMASSAQKFSILAKTNPFIDKWSKKRSLPLKLREVKASDLNYLTNDDNLKPAVPMTNSTKASYIEFLEAEKYRISTGLKKPVLYDGIGVSDYIQKLKTGEGSSRTTENNAFVLYCGGPISAMSICPRKDAEGNEIIAISAFNNEVDIAMPRDVATYVQFWTYSPNISAKCAFLLEVPASVVLDLAWCPNLVDAKQKPNVQIDEVATDCLGLIAVATDRGISHVYRIPRKLPSYSAEIYSVNPCGSLVHPSVDVLCRNIKQDVDESINDEESQNENADADSEKSDFSEYVVEQRFEIPIISLSWSVFNGSSRIAAVSEAGRILIWDLNSKLSEIPSNITKEAILNAGQPLYYPPKVIFDPTWDSPPKSVCWRAADSVATSFNNKSVMVYSVNEEDTFYRESAYRSIGSIVGSASRTFEGIFTADSPFINIEGICYTCTSYLDSERRRSEITSIPNMHQLQAFDISVCELTGIVTTVGADGRLNQALCGSLIPRVEDIDVNFQYGRPILQLLRHHQMKARQDVSDIAPPNREHDQCSENTWLELRLGDAALLDTFAVKRHSRVCEEVILDRRTESLTHAESSPITGGFTAAGGEAGFVFLLPTLL